MAAFHFARLAAFDRPLTRRPIACVGRASSSCMDHRTGQPRDAPREELPRRGARTRRPAATFGKLAAESRPAWGSGRPAVSTPPRLTERRGSLSQAVADRASGKRLPCCGPGILRTLNSTFGQQDGCQGVWRIDGLPLAPGVYRPEANGPILPDVEFLTKGKFAGKKAHRGRTFPRYCYLCGVPEHSPGSTLLTRAVGGPDRMAAGPGRRTVRFGWPRFIRTRSAGL